MYFLMTVDDGVMVCRVKRSWTRAKRVAGMRWRLKADKDEGLVLQVYVPYAHEDRDKCLYTLLPNTAYSTPIGKMWFAYQVDEALTHFC